MPRFLITQFSVAEYGYEVEAKDEDEAHQKVADDHEDVELLEDGNPIAWHDCYSRDSTIEEIFKNFGGKQFREGERRVIKRLLNGEPAVIASGGGSFMDVRTRKLIREKGISIWLPFSINVLMLRRSSIKTCDKGQSSLSHILPSSGVTSPNSVSANFLVFTIPASEINALIRLSTVATDTPTAPPIL